MSVGISARRTIRSPRRVNACGCCWRALEPGSYQVSVLCFVDVVSLQHIYIYVLKMIIYAYLDVCLNKVTDLYINNMHLLDSDIFISFMVQSTVFDSLHWHEWL